MSNFLDDGVDTSPYFSRRPDAHPSTRKPRSGFSLTSENIINHRQQQQSPQQQQRQRQRETLPSHTDRPRSNRHSSLPRALFASGNASIFGSSPTPTDTALTTASQTAMVQPYDPNHVVLPPSSTSSQQPHQREDHPSMPGDARILPCVEKDADDPSTPPKSTRGARRTESTTLTTLSRLFAVQAATSPFVSRNSSYTFPSQKPTSYSRSAHAREITPLPDHLYTHGFLGGRHSDITVHAFGQQYRLHRLILDRSPFFSSALSEPWLEANAREMSVHPEDIDPSITKASFEAALKRLYGFYEEDCDSVGLFATGCWLEMQDLVDSSIASMLQQMTPETLSPLIKLVTTNYYGRAGDKILASTKSMLCRDGWQMLLRHWDGIPGDIVREIVGGDGFFVDSEWDRWIFAKRILDRRLKAEATKGGLIGSGKRQSVQKFPEAANRMAVRFDTVYRRSNSASGEGVPDSVQQWNKLYTSPDIEPLLVLLDEGIHYVHLEFEQLQLIRTARDCLGLPVVPEKLISNALWSQMELRQKVINSQDADLELGLSQQCEEDPSIDTTRDTTMSITNSADLQQPKGKTRHTDAEEVTGDIHSGSWDDNGKPRKFWIPSSDCNIVMGGNADPIIATPSNISMQRHASRMSTTLQPEDVQWAADFAAFTSQPQPPDGLPEGSNSHPNESATISYTHFPPFRFAVEFPNPRMLKNTKRVYSRTVFYAGSLWNIYIQKVASSRSKQLGVYLHRAKERETEETLNGTPGLAHASVDERIGQLEREMLLRGDRQGRRLHRPMQGSQAAVSDGGDSSASDRAEGSAGIHTGLDAVYSAVNEGHNRIRRTPRQSMRSDNSNPNNNTGQAAASTSFVLNNILIQDSDSPSDDDSDLDSPTTTTIPPPRIANLPTLPAYVDTRPTIKTYFKIYSPSRGGRMLSVYESAPDKFNFSQSWGWKSTTLMLDEGLGDDDDEDKGQSDDVVDESGGLTGRRRTSNKGDGRLRFMVVIGVI